MQGGQDVLEPVEEPASPPRVAKYRHARASTQQLAAAVCRPSAVLTTPLSSVTCDAKSTSLALYTSYRAACESAWMLSPALHARNMVERPAEAARAK